MVKVLMKDTVMHEEYNKLLIIELLSDACIEQSRDEWIRYNDTEVSLILLPDYNFSNKVKVRNVSKL